MNKINIESNFSFGDGFIFGNEFRDNDLKVFDWDKFTEYLLLLDKLPEDVIIGLNGDFKHTSSYAIHEEKICESPSMNMWLSSTHCIPCFTIDEITGYECWLWEYDTEYNMNTFWPKHCVEKLQNEKFIR